MKKKTDNEDIILSYLNQLNEQKDKALKEAKNLFQILLDWHFIHNKENLSSIFSNNKQFKNIEVFLQNRTKKGELSLSEIDYILENKNSLDEILELFEVLINTFPSLYLFDSIYIPAERNFLHLIAENVLGLINNNVKIPKHLLNIGQEYEKAIQTVNELPLNIISTKVKYKREGKSSYIYIIVNLKKLTC